MAEKPATAEPKRRWWQFSLRTLLIGVALLGAALTWFGWQAKIVQERKAMMKVVRKSTSQVHRLELVTPATVGFGAWLRSVALDDRQYDEIYVGRDLAEQLPAMRKLFPEAFVGTCGDFDPRPRATH